MSIAKSVADNYEDQEFRNSFVDIALDLYGLTGLAAPLWPV